LSPTRTSRTQYGGQTPVVALAIGLVPPLPVVRVVKATPPTDPGVKATNALALLTARVLRIITPALAV